LVGALLLSGCSWEVLPPPVPVPADKVFIMYDNINADDSRPFTGNVDAAGRAVALGALDSDERVVVFERMQSGNVIYELVKDSSDKSGFNKVTLKKYIPGEFSALSVEEAIASVVGYIRTVIYPEATRWGLAFGSHGRGWVPASSTVAMARRGGVSGDVTHPFAALWAEWESPMTRYLSGYGERIDVADFVDALDGDPGSEIGSWRWDFVLLDDCFMASVEALYEMRTLADYVIASPTEIMMAGFPYDRVVESVFSDWSEEGFKDVGYGFVDYYRESGGTHPCATVAVVKMSQIEALTATIAAMGLTFNELTSDEVGEIQYYEGITKPAHVFYDLDDYLRRITRIDPAMYEAFTSQLALTVVYSDHTEQFFSGFPYRVGTRVPVDRFSGLNVFVPWSGTTPLFDDYRQTQWCRTVYGE
jgi:hypothetical protein